MHLLLIKIFRNINPIIINKLILDTFHVDNNLDPYLKIRIKLFNCIADFYKQNKLESQIIVMPLFKCYLAILKDIQIKVNYLIYRPKKTTIIRFSTSSGPP